MKSRGHWGRRASFGARVLLTSIVATVAGLGLLCGTALGQDEPQFTAEFKLKDCKFTTVGANPYFILKPGYQLILENRETAQRVVKTVLNETETIVLPGIGPVQTRVLREQHYENGRLVEVSTNFFAICTKTNDVFYFGEQVDIFNPNGRKTHDGSWRAGLRGARPGIIMPGTFLLGSRYFQEQAPGVAMDMAEHVEMGLRVETEAGTFKGCVRVIETTPLEPGTESEKIYCPGVGQVDDDGLRLVRINGRSDD